MKTYQASQVGCIASIPDLRRWWVEGCNFPDQGFGLSAFNATLRHQTMSIGEGLGPGVYMAITLNKPSPTAGLASLVCSTAERTILLASNITLVGRGCAN